MQVKYTLNQQDMTQFYRETVSADDRQVSYSLWRFRLLGIFTAAMILVLMKGSQTSLIIASVVIALWLILSFTVARKFFVEQYVKGIVSSMKFDFREMSITVTEKSTVVNGKSREVRDYSSYSSCMMESFRACRCSLASSRKTPKY